jgi:hypothetical protein
MRPIPGRMLVLRSLARGCALEWTEGRWLVLTDGGWMPLATHRNRYKPHAMAA